MEINGLRFIIGSGCNYNCFFCHHEGYEKQSYDDVDKDKLLKISNFTKNNGIHDISITGGEPFIYWNRLKYLFELFSDNNYKITLNSNLSLADKFIEIIKQYSNVEYHINFSSLKNDVHKKIIGKEYLEKLKNNLELFKSNGLNVCLNIPVLNGINDNELMDILNYCKTMDFKPRFLVLFPMNAEQQKYFLDVNEIMEKIPESKLEKKYSYGRYDVKSNIGNYEIVKCLCIDKECDLCKKTTYVHITPNLNMRLCMLGKKEYPIDFTNEKTVNESFSNVSKRLKYECNF